MNASSNGKKKIFGVPVDVISVSLFGLFLGISTTMVYSYLGLFMTKELHTTEANVAIVDGIVEFIAYVTRIFAGVISDVMKNRKVILLVGCFLTLLMKPVFAMAHSVFHILFAQSIERIGNGLQASPRDALIADLSGVGERGRSFGFCKSLKTVGAFTGTLISMLILSISSENFRVAFACSAIPVVCAIICLFRIKVKKNVDEKVKSKKNSLSLVFKKEYIQSLSQDFWKIIAFSALFELCHFSEALFPIYANQFVSVSEAASVSLFVSLGQVPCAFIIGALADKYGTRKLIAVCIVMMLSANILFMSASSIYFVFAGAFLWGGQMTAIQGVFLSAISERVDASLRGTAIGIYYCVIGVSFLLSSVLAGNIWTNFGSKYAFLYSISICLIAFLTKSFFLKRGRVDNGIK